MERGNTRMETFTTANISKLFVDDGSLISDILATEKRVMTHNIILYEH